jgi:hypothetical protein
MPVGDPICQIVSSGLLFALERKRPPGILCVPSNVPALPQHFFDLRHKLAPDEAHLARPRHVVPSFLQKIDDSPHCGDTQTPVVLRG